MTKLVILPLPSDTPVSPTGLAIADRPGTRYLGLDATTGSIEGNSEFCGKRLGPQKRKSPISSKITEASAIDRVRKNQTLSMPHHLPSSTINGSSWSAPPPSPLGNRPNRLTLFEGNAMIPASPNWQSFGSTLTIRGHRTPRPAAVQQEINPLSWARFPPHRMRSRAGTQLEPPPQHCNAHDSRIQRRILIDQSPSHSDQLGSLCIGHSRPQANDFG
jgi:hypothetical protein